MICNRANLALISFLENLVLAVRLVSEYTSDLYVFCVLFGYKQNTLG